MTAAGDRNEGYTFATVQPRQLCAQVALGEGSTGPSPRGVTPHEREARRPPPVDTSSFGMGGEEPLPPLSPSMPPPPRLMGPSVRLSTPPLRHEPGADDDDDDFLGTSPLVAPDIAPSEPCRQPRASGQPRESGH